MTKPYVHSNFDRIPDDNYQTVDPRCVRALIDSWELAGKIVDCCSPNGSKIVSELLSRGYDAYGMGNAFADFDADWVITNPPYKRGIVDRIVWKQIQRVEDTSIYGTAILLRNNFDFAKSRYEMFTHQNYAGQIHMMFRPWWTEHRDAQPIHNYVWHIWKSAPPAFPIVMYWKEDK